MPLNTPTYFFGPSIPDSYDAVNIVFVSSPIAEPETAIALLYSDRYVTTNYPVLNKFNLYTATQNSTGTVSYSFDGSSLGDEETSRSGFSGAGLVEIPIDSSFGIDTLHNPVRIRGIYVSPANSWYPIIENGVVWRRHIIQSQETVDTTLPASGQSSWLLRSGLVTGDEVFLIYTVPEVRYGKLTQGVFRTFPASGFHLREVTESVFPSAPGKLRYEGDARVITGITVNGAVKFPSSGEVFDGSIENTYIKNIDYKMKTISVEDAYAPEDVIQVTYLAYANYINYSGYKDFNSDWWSYDCNPEYGHVIKDPSTGNYQNAVDALMAQTIIYMIPAAYMKVETTVPTGTAFQFAMTIRFESAFNWGESHFVRHLIGQDQEDVSTRQQDGPINTWGHAVFGRNYYDEQAFVVDDIFSQTIPSMLRLGKIVIGAPASVNALAVADTRRRGGGLPEDFPMEAVNTNAEGIDTLRGYWDLGIFGGAAIREGGVMLVKIDPSILNTFSEEEVYQIVRDRTPPGIDINISYEAL